MRDAAPKRIQLRRTKGWRKPDGAVVVARPSRWGNPHRVERTGPEWRHEGDWFVDDGGQVVFFDTREQAARYAVAAFDVDLGLRMEEGTVDLSPLRGRDLACWCPLDQPCHADVLLGYANQEADDA